MKNQLPHDSHRFFWFILAPVFFIFITHLNADTIPAGIQSKPNLMTYHYLKNDLGAVYKPTETTFKLWAPPATGVSLALFEDGVGPSFSLRRMTRDTDGLWCVTIDGDLSGKYYLYQVALPAANGRPPAEVMVNDPYAHGSSAN